MFSRKFIIVLFATRKNLRFCIKFSVCSLIALIFCVSCASKSDITKGRAEFKQEIIEIKLEVNRLFDYEKKILSQVDNLKSRNLISENKLKQEYENIKANRKKLVEKCAFSLKTYILKYQDKESRNFANEIFIKPQIQRIKYLEQFINNKLPEIKNKLPREIESDYIIRSGFEKNLIDYFEIQIGEQLTLLEKYFGDYEEVKEFDLFIVRPYYQRLMLSLPLKEKKLSQYDEMVLHQYLSKMKRLLPYS